MREGQAQALIVACLGAFARTICALWYNLQTPCPARNRLIFQIDPHGLGKRGGAAIGHRTHGAIDAFIARMALKSFLLPIAEIAWR